MELKLFLTFLLHFSILQFIWGTDTYYIELKKDKIEIGKYTEKFSPKKYFSLSTDSPDLDKVVAFLTKDGSKGKEDKVLYYFHSLYGGAPFYHKNSLKRLNELESFDRIIAIEWHAEALFYKKTWLKAIDQGKRIGPLMNALWSVNKNSVLCHSMGNRIFEGVTHKLDDAQPKLESIVLAAADLDFTCFDGGNTINWMPDGQIHVYVNRKDGALKISRQIHKRKRLGMNALEKEFEENHTLAKKMNIIDAIKLSGKRNPGHIYFKRNKLVFADVKNKLILRDK